MSLNRNEPNNRKLALSRPFRALTNRLAARMDPVIINVAELQPELADPLRPFLNGVQSLTAGEAHRLYSCYDALLVRRKQMYWRQIEVVKAATTLEQEVGQYQRLLTDNRR